MDTIITRCPACSTAFNVNSQQLASARGAVRCGSCLQLFKATDHIVFESLQQESEPDPAETSAQESRDLAPQEIEHRTEDEPASTALDNTENNSQRTSKKEDSSLPSWDQHPEDSNPNPQDESNAGQEFEELASDMDEDPFSPLEEILNNRPAPDLEKEEHPQEVELGCVDLISELEDALSMDSIESGNLSLTADSEFNLGQADEPHAAQKPEDDTLDSDRDMQECDTENLQTEEAEQEGCELELEAQIIAQKEEPSKAEVIESIELEPLEMEFRQEIPNRNWLWGGGAALALLAAIGQLAWIKFDDLNRQPPYRDYYQIACNILSCPLPPQIDLSKLKASNLVVRSHPETEQALVVHMVLLNLAQFEQEFPGIQLTFSDIQGKTLASRVFRPSEYLAGELAGANRMPIQRPIHLSLDIVDPGNEAVNYKVDVR